MKQRALYAAVGAGGAIGLIASFLQTMEKLTLLKNPDTQLVCDLGSVFSCTNVLNAWQSSVFGFPNSLMCMVLFTIFGTVGLVGLTGGKLTRGLRLGVHGLALFTLFFGMWFLAQSTFVIGSLCLYCLFCFSGLLLLNWGFVRINAADLPIGNRGRAGLERAIAAGADTFVWLVLALTIAFVMVMKFAWL